MEKRRAGRQRRIPTGLSWTGLDSNKGKRGGTPVPSEPSKSSTSNSDEGEEEIKRTRGRPRRNPNGGSTIPTGVSDSSKLSVEQNKKEITRKRGRPPVIEVEQKNLENSVVSRELSFETNNVADSKRKGRQPKRFRQEDVQGTDNSLDAKVVHSASRITRSKQTGVCSGMQDLKLKRRQTPNQNSRNKSKDDDNSRPSKDENVGISIESNRNEMRRGRGHSKKLVHIDASKSEISKPVVPIPKKRKRGKGQPSNFKKTKSVESASNVNNNSDVDDSGTEQKYDLSGRASKLSQSLKQGKSRLLRKRNSDSETPVANTLEEKRRLVVELDRCDEQFVSKGVKKDGGGRGSSHLPIPTISSRTSSSETALTPSKNRRRPHQKRGQNKRVVPSKTTNYSQSAEPTKPGLEVCVDNIQSIVNAVHGGASRIELCSALSEGGLTPTIGLLKLGKQVSNIPIFVMIRPRCGDFIYSEEEMQIMEMDIVSLKDAGADGFVFGMLDELGNVDEEKCRRLLTLTAPLPSTFHRAFDLTHDPMRSLQTVVNLGFQRILTSGLQPTAQIGISLLKKLVDESKDQIVIMAGTGVNPGNVEEIVKGTGVKEIHGSARVKVFSKMLKGCQESQVSMGKSDDDAIHFQTSATVVEEIVNKLITTFKEMERETLELGAKIECTEISQDDVDVCVLLPQSKVHSSPMIDVAYNSNDEDVEVGLSDFSPEHANRLQSNRNSPSSLKQDQPGISALDSDEEPVKIRKLTSDSDKDNTSAKSATFADCIDTNRTVGAEIVQLTSSFCSSNDGNSSSYYTARDSGGNFNDSILNSELALARGDSKDVTSEISTTALVNVNANLSTNCNTSSLVSSYIPRSPQDQQQEGTSINKFHAGAKDISDTLYGLENDNIATLPTYNGTPSVFHYTARSPQSPDEDTDKQTSADGIEIETLDVSGERESDSLAIYKPVRSSLSEEDTAETSTADVDIVTLDISSESDNMATDNDEALSDNAPQQEGDIPDTSTSKLANDSLATLVTCSATPSLSTYAAQSHDEDTVPETSETFDTSAELESDSEVTYKSLESQEDTAETSTAENDEVVPQDISSEIDNTNNEALSDYSIPQEEEDELSALLSYTSPYSTPK